MFYSFADVSLHLFNKKIQLKNMKEGSTTTLVSNVAKVATSNAPKKTVASPAVQQSRAATVPAVSVESSASNGSNGNVADEAEGTKASTK